MDKTRDDDVDATVLYFLITFIPSIIVEIIICTCLTKQQLST